MGDVEKFREVLLYLQGDIPWIGADYGEVIPYEAVFYRTKGGLAAP